MPATIVASVSTAARGPACDDARARRDGPGPLDGAAHQPAWCGRRTLPGDPDRSRRARPRTADESRSGGRLRVELHTQEVVTDPQPDRARPHGAVLDGASRIGRPGKHNRTGVSADGRCRLMAVVAVPP